MILKIMMGVYINCWSVLINTKKYGIKLNVLNRKMMILMVWWSDDYDADYDDNNYENQNHFRWWFTFK